MRWVIRITAETTSPSAVALVELETGWWSNTWRVSASGWSIRVGSRGNGTWRYFPEHRVYGHLISEASIGLFENGSDWVGSLEVVGQQYPLRVGQSGRARIDVASGPPCTLSAYDTTWRVIR